MTFYSISKADKLQDLAKAELSLPKSVSFLKRSLIFILKLSYKFGGN